MQSRKSAAFVAAVVLACALFAPLASAGEKEDRAAILAATASWMKAFNAGDVDALVALYASDAILMPPGAPVAKGQAAIRQYIAQETAATKAAGVTLALGSRHEAGVSGNLAWDSGSYVVRDGSGATVDSGSFLAVWNKVGGKWIYVRDIWNSDRPLAPAPPTK